MSSGLIPLEDFEHAIAHLSFIPTQQLLPPKEQHIGPLEELGQRLASLQNDTLLKTQRTPSLPLEIIYLIGRLLFDSSHTTYPSWLLVLHSPTLQDAPNRSSMHRDFRALLNLSSICKSFRSLLAPLIWHSIYFHHPRRFGEFVQIMKRYKSISSPLTALPGAIPGMAASYEWRQEYPLRLVKELHLIMPQKYPGFNQDLLVALLKDGMNSSLRHVVWAAEDLPAASTLKAMLAQDYYMPDRRRQPEEAFEDRQQHLGLASEIEQQDIVRWTQNSRDGEGFPATGYLLPANQVLHKEKKQSYNDEQGLQSLSINCKCFWPGHASLSQFTSLQHIQLTYYDLFLLPPHLPALLQNLHVPLLTLSLSTSKTSLFHSIPLINSGCFDHLETLDLYPVTPEYPLPHAIRRCRKSLRNLRLVMDISANFVNFDNLWKVLGGNPPFYDDDKDDMIGSMEALEVLHIDPMPQQNTAPSFVQFVETCPRLEWINGRRKDSFAPGFETVNPDEITSAVYF
jgi:hypothetical protein